MGWTDALRQEEKEFIEKNFEKMTIGEIALSLGRSYFTIQKYTSCKKLHKSHKWTKEEDAVLLKLWGTYCAEYIAKRLNVDKNSVYNRIRRLRKKGIIENDQ